MPCTASYFKMDKYTGCYITPEYLLYNYNSIHNMGFNTHLTMDTNLVVEEVEVEEVSDLVKRI